MNAVCKELKEHLYVAPCGCARFKERYSKGRGEGGCLGGRDNTLALEVALCPHQYYLDVIWVKVLFHLAKPLRNAVKGFSIRDIIDQ